MHITIINWVNMLKVKYLIITLNMHVIIFLSLICLLKDKLMTRSYG